MNEREADDPRFAHIMLWRDLVEQGWNDRAIKRMLDSKVWVRLRHGAYVTTLDWQRVDASGRHELTTRAVLLQSRTSLVASHISGVPLYEGPTWGLDLSTVHVTRVDCRPSRHEAGVRRHRGAILEDDTCSRHGLEVMCASRLALEVTTVSTVEPALAVMNHLLHHKFTTAKEIRKRYEAGIEHWPDTLSTEIVIRLADPRMESVGETRFCYFCYLEGLPAPIPQYEVRDGRGSFVGRVDFAWPELGIFVEFDGRTKYLDHLRPGESVTDAVLREKRREERICEVTGWRCIRVTWSDLENPAQLARRIRQVMAGVPSAH